MEPRKPTFGSLFAGIGGLDLGLERAGWICKWQVEIDSYCLAVLRKHWPNVPKFGDVKTIREGELENVDLICGGFPCQSVSVAGKRKAQADERWLWPEFARIIRMVRPRFVLVENVPGLRSANQGRAMGEVLGDLAACGYDAEWNRVSAASVGAPHLRERIFIVAYTNSVGLDRCSNRWGNKSPAEWSPSGVQKGLQRELETEQVDQDVADSESERAVPIQQPRFFNRIKPSRADVAYANSNGCLCRQTQEFPNQVGKQTFSQVSSGRQWAVEPCLGDLVNGLPPELAGRLIRVAKKCPDRVNKLRALGNSIVPQVAEYVGRRVLTIMVKKN